MKKIGLFVLIFSLVAIITACGAGDTSAPPATEAPAPAEESEEAAASEPEEAVVNEAEEATASEPEEAAAEEPEEAAAEEPEETAAEESEEAIAEEPDEAAADEAGDAQEIELEMNVSGYSPSEITVKPGSHILFNVTNTDSEEHDLYNRRADIDVALQAGEDLVYEWVAPEEPGTYVAECSFHEGLQMTVIVEE